MLKTTILLAGLTALFLVIGYFLGGQQGMLIAFVLALGMNFFSYFYSDKIVLKLYKAQPLDPARHQKLYSMIQELARRAEIPAPKAYIIENDQPNAFATGRNPANGALAVTTGLLQHLDEPEVAGVLAHEIGHIKNRDTLIMTITATIAGAISMLANFAMFFGGSRDGERTNPIAAILIMLLAPIAAGLIQMAISRTREYKADQIGGFLCGNPLDLASALQKISAASQHIVNPTAERNPTTAHLFISNPLNAHKIDNLFSTHPKPENRIRALQEQAHEMGITNKKQSVVQNPWA